MASHTRQTRSHRNRPPRAALRVALAVSAAGAALVAGSAASASAADAAGSGRGTSAPAGDREAQEATTPGAAVTDALWQSVAGGLGPAKHLRINPLAGTRVDPLDNAVGTQIADFQPISTAVATGPLADGASLSELPVIGAATELLPG